MNRINEIKNIIKEHIINNIAPYRGLNGNGEIVTLTHKEEEKVRNLINSGKTNKDIISLYHQGTL